MWSPRPNVVAPTQRGRPDPTWSPRNVVAPCERSDGECGHGMPRPYITGMTAIAGAARRAPYLHADRMALGSTLMSSPLPTV
jgi:hypothetical protein